MIEWFSWLEVWIAVGAGVLCLTLGLLGRIPNDLSVGAILLVEVLLLAQIVVSIIAPAVGNAATGSVLEFWLYLGSAALIPPIAVLWALLDRARWSTVILGIASLAIAVMLYRMHAIWFVQHS